MMSEEQAPPPNPPWPFVEVLWEDSSATHESWSDEAELPDEAQIISRGWLIKETKRCIKIAASCCNWGTKDKWIFGESVTIPHKAILKRTNL